MKPVFSSPAKQWQKDSVACELLAMLWKHGEFERSTMGTRLAKQASRARRKVSKNAYAVALGRCMRKGWVEEAEKAGRQFLILTKKGELQALLACLCKKRVARGKSGRGTTLWLALFDIPEVARKTRDFLRWFLLMIGFRQLQKSAYVTTRPIPAEALRYLEHSGLRKYIRFMRVQEADDIAELYQMCEQ